MSPPTPAEERYVHLASSSNDLNGAWRILQEIRSGTSHPLTGPAFMFAIVCYARPYTTSRGELQRYVLDPLYVPPEHLQLHNRLIAARHQILAHSDLTVKDARVHVASTNTGKFVGVVQNTLSGAEEISTLGAVIDLVAKTLVALYSAIDQLEAQLPPNA